MENNRTILAIALIILVWSGYSMLFPPQKTVPAESTQQVGERSADVETENQLVKKSVSGEKVEQQRPITIPSEEKRVRVESERFLFELTSTGGMLRDVILKKYKQENSPESKPVNLTEFSGKSLATFKTAGREGLFLPADLPYALKDARTDYKLSAGESQTVTFVAQVSNGLEIHKSYTFYADSYQIDLEINLINRSQQQARGVFDLSLVNVWDDTRGDSTRDFVGSASLIGEKIEEDKPKDLQTSSKVYSKGLVWSGFVTKYFATLVNPQSGAAQKINVESGEGYVENRFSSPNLSLEPNERISFNYVAYLGPKDYDILQSIGHHFDKAVDLGFFSIIGQPLLVVLKFFHTYLGNWGFAIVLLTICIKALFWPLTQKSYTSMQAMQKLQPQMTKLREKYASDKQRLNQEMMSLYKENRVNPFGGCLPILIQIPVFFALYQVLLNSIDLRHAPFILWITDLSAKDPYYVTPLIMGVTMFLQQKMTPSNMDPTQARIMLMMPVVFTFLFLNFPSGLVVYWLVNNILTIAQQYLIKRQSATS